MKLRGFYLEQREKEEEKDGKLVREATEGVSGCPRPPLHWRGFSTVTLPEAAVGKAAPPARPFSVYLNRGGSIPPFPLGFSFGQKCSDFKTYG